MYDMEVIISDEEYRRLKLSEGEVSKLKENVKGLEEKLWTYEGEMKEKTEVVEKYGQQVKELSRSAMGLSKRVLMGEDMLSSQEEKWIKREK